MSFTKMGKETRQEEDVGLKKIGKLIKENSEGKSQETKTGQSQKPAVGLESN